MYQRSFKKGTGKIALVGPDYFGRPSTLTVMPSRIPGIFWDTGHSVIEVTADLVRRKFRRLAIEHDGKTLNIIEHILVLRALHIDDFIIACESGWPPYDGSAEALWGIISPHVEMRGVFGHSRTLRHVLRAEVPGDKSRWIEMRPSREPLTVTVEIDYHGLGPHTETFGPVFDRLLDAKALGWPPWTKALCTLLHPVGLAPNVKNFTWPGEQDREETLRRAARHRALDIVGTLAIAFPKRTLVCGRAISHHGGHGCDLELVKKLGADAWE